MTSLSPLQVPEYFIDPGEIAEAGASILIHEQAQKKTQQQVLQKIQSITDKDHCSTQHKAADDKRNASTLKGCDDTGLMGACCRHDLSTLAISVEPGRAAVYQLQSLRGSSRKLIRIQISTSCMTLAAALTTPSNMLLGITGLIHSSTFHNMIGLEKLIQRQPRLVSSNSFLKFFWLEEQQRLKILFWSAKSALFKAAVELQAETQPLRASKERGERVGTLLKEKIYAAIKRQYKLSANNNLQSHAPAEREWPQNQDFNYSNFMKMGLDDPFWNNGFLCLSRDPWAVDPV
ncbi:hypothetical protein VP01_1254g3, partial [Puccinia sorghi]